MNYRHAFHAGNFADVLKHAVLTRILVHLRRKPTPFRVIDIHAGAGRYDLTAEEAQRSGERRDGIARLEAASLRAPARTLLAPYIDAVAACNPTGRLTIYPGSPWLACALLRARSAYCLRA
jgi:23S rRNA (adenine2030-N6)-methyltransferase